MSRAAQYRQFVLSAVRTALGARHRRSGSETKRSPRALCAHPRGTIPARARQDEAALLDLFQAMLESQGAEVTRAATPEEAVQAIAANLRLHDLPPILRLGEDAVLRALPWQAAPDLSAHFRGSGWRRSRRPVARRRCRRGDRHAGARLRDRTTRPPSPSCPSPTRSSFAAATSSPATRTPSTGCGRSTARVDLPRTVNLISGPSRTADIEQTIVRGAHGPKRLHVVILG